MGILFYLLVILAVFLLWSAILPRTFQLFVRKSINGNIDDVYKHFADLRMWHLWFPTTSFEPEAEVMYSPVTNEVGGFIAWQGSRIGTVRIINQQLEKDLLVQNRLHCYRPFSFQAVSNIEFKESKGKVDIQWSVSGSFPFYLGFFVNRWLKKYQRSAQVLLNFSLDRLEKRLNPKSTCYQIDFFAEHFLATQDYIFVSYKGPQSGLADAKTNAKKLLSDYLTGKYPLTDSLFFTIINQGYDGTDTVSVKFAAMVDELKSDLPAEISQSSYSRLPVMKAVFEGQADQLPDAWELFRLYAQLWKSKKPILYPCYEFSIPKSAKNKEKLVLYIALAA